MNGGDLPFEMEMGNENPFTLILLPAPAFSTIFCSEPFVIVKRESFSPP
jgi:hypothetical protein